MTDIGYSQFGPRNARRPQDSVMKSEKYMTLVLLPKAVLRTHSPPAISASLATVFMLRAVPFLAAGILSFESPWPSG
jgi:hypothetical protein